MKFYAFNDDGGDKINLILDHNTTRVIAWNSSGSNISGPDSTFLNQLKTDTDSWKGTLTPADYNFFNSGWAIVYTIDYSEYKARIITANEIAKITGNIGWDDIVVNSTFYFDSNIDTASATCKYGNTTGCKYGWLYDRTATVCKDFGCLNNSDQDTYGYWTATAVAGSTTDVFHVYYDAGEVTGIFPDESNYSGIRPVITISKSNLS